MPRKDPGPSVKDPKRYEALRREGYSKEKSARIANTDPHVAGRHGGKAPAYEDWSRADLYARARDLGLSGVSRFSKAELIAALRRG